MEKLKRWVFLSLAGVLAFLLGGRTLESAAIDHDNATSR